MRRAVKRSPVVQIEREFDGVRVLLAEDNEANQFVASELLGRLGIELEIAENGRKAVELVAAKPFAAVLMDMQMPEMDGLDATRHIRQQPAFKDLPIIAMTANAMKSDVEACLAAGMNDFISKPIDRAVLVKTLRRWLPAAPTVAEPNPTAEPVENTDEFPTLDGIDVADTVRRLGIPFDRLRPLFIRFADGQRKTVEDLRGRCRRRQRRRPAARPRPGRGRGQPRGGRPPGGRQGPGTGRQGRADRPGRPVRRRRSASGGRLPGDRRAAAAGVRHGLERPAGPIAGRPGAVAAAAGAPADRPGRGRPDRGRGRPRPVRLRSDWRGTTAGGSTGSGNLSTDTSTTRRARPRPSSWPP